MKKFTALVIFSCLVLLFAKEASAQNTLYTPKARPALQNQKALTGSNSANLNSTGNSAADNLKNRATAEIDRRLTALNQALAKLNTLKRVSDTAKSTLSGLIQNEITSLTSLKTKVQGDTDLATLKTDAQSIITSHRIFAFFLPQIRILAAADSLINSADKMSTLSGKLENRINTAKTAGADIAVLETSLASMNENITNAKTQANSAITLVTPLTPDGYPANRSTLLTAKQDLQIAFQSLKEAAKDARDIMQGLKALSKDSGTSTGSADLMMKKPNSSAVQSAPGI